jgi:WD40 repeat protein
MVLVDLTMAEPPRYSGPDGSIPDWSPDSQYLAYGAHRLVVYDVAADERTVVLSGYGGGILNLVWSPDNRTIAFACCFQEGGGDGVQIGEIQRVEVASGQVETVGETTLAIGGGVPAVCWSAEGQVVSKQENHVRCSYDVGGNVLSPDGRWAAVLSVVPVDGELPVEPNLLSVWEVGSEVVVWERPVAVSRVVWSPDGVYLLLDDNQADSPIWQVEADGTGEVEVVVENGFLVGVAVGRP